MWNIKPENRFWIGIYGFTAFILLVAVGVFGWLAWTSYEEPGVGHVAGARPPSSAAAIPDERYDLLATFQAPQYIPEPHVPKDFQSAMRLYASQDFKDAVPQLRAVANATPNFQAAHFYLGICLLLTGDHISGIQELRAVTQAGNTPYLEPARFYLAKGLLGEHDIPRAQKQLDSVIAQHGEFEKQATVLLMQIRAS
jgi:TolA-binding protein